jgi:hypothetical protein
VTGRDGRVTEQRQVVSLGGLEDRFVALVTQRRDDARSREVDPAHRVLVGAVVDFVCGPLRSVVGHENRSVDGITLVQPLVEYPGVVRVRERPREVRIIDARDVEAGRRPEHPRVDAELPHLGEFVVEVVDVVASVDEAGRGDLVRVDVHRRRVRMREDLLAPRVVDVGYEVVEGLDDVGVGIDDDREVVHRRDGTRLVAGHGCGTPAHDNNAVGCEAVELTGGFKWVAS